MAKSSKKKRKSSKRSNKKKLDIYTMKKVIAVFFTLSLVSYAFYMGQEYNSSNNTQINDTEDIAEILKEHNNLIKKVRDTKAAYIDKIKPKLVIIIDDIYTKKQLLAIKSLNIKITPSIFPPFELSHNSHKLAENLKHYMVHLPMESIKKQFNRHYKTLKTSFSNREIVDRIEEIRRLFPTAKYINNHTGSLFTSNYTSMSLTYKSIRENGFIFIDSKTIHTSKVKDISIKYGDRYIARDIFIDNIHTIPYIHRQLKKAVRIAKRKKYAIVIGHPHKVTMRALSLAKDILKDVEIVYIDDIIKQPLK